jgi:hypothetical protein
MIQQSVIVYQRLGGGPSVFQPVDVIDYVPLINKKDIDNGEIIRYFARPVHQSSPSEIVEIDKPTFQSLSNNKLYNVVSLRWLIRGKVADIPGLTNINTPTRLYTGVRTANRLFIETADEKMPGLKTIITDYLKFWQGE